MNWKVSGVPSAIRARAEIAARSAGLSTGAWMSQTILESLVTPPQAGPPAAPRPGRRPVRSALGFLAGLLIVGGSVGGFVYLLDADPDSLGPRHPSPEATDLDNRPVHRGTSKEVASLRAKAAADDPAAQTRLARKYLAGDGVAADPAAAARLFEEAAVQGYAEAQYELGLLYETGRGRDKNADLAFFWEDSAAGRGSSHAQFQLGVLYAEGRGTPQDYGHAAVFFKRAAEAGDARAAFALGVLYERGLGVAVDPAEARRWWTRAAEAGNAGARARLEGKDAPPPFALAPDGGKDRHASAATTPLATNDIAEIQRLLAKLSFDPGTADGRLTRETANAIRSYQTIAGLQPDGEPSPALLESLRAVAGSDSH